MKKLISLFLSCLLLAPANGHIKSSFEDYIIRKIMSQMTLEEKIGQLFIVRPDCLDPEYISDDKNPKYKVFTYLTEGMKETYEEYPAGGFVIFSKNIVDEEQLITFNDDLHSLNVLTPIICIDEEGGSVSRIANDTDFDVPHFTSMEDVASKNDYDYTYMVGFEIGKYLSKYGFDLDFAPVADVNTNPQNKVIGSRAFGSDPYLVSNMVQNFIFGMHEKNVMTCIKHYPGHGDTSGDSHFDLTYTPKNWDEMMMCEMISFMGGIEAKTEMIMVAHIAAPNVTGNQDIATFSYELVTEKLRKELKYEGIIITDSMEMGTIVDNYDTAEATIKAIKAGVDVILLPQVYKEAFDGLKEAVLNGEILMERIDESVYRILKMKLEHFGFDEEHMLPSKYKITEDKVDLR